jgi:sugar fermentation stimulation protein A
MRFSSPLIKGRLIKRYKRFLADILLEDGTPITAHCANSGAMPLLQTPGSAVWVTPVPPENPRKLRYDWHFIEDQGYRVGINTSFPNILVEEALHHQRLDFALAYPRWKREVPYGTQCRIDFLLENPQGQKLFLEVKNSNHREGNTVYFPDCRTDRGAKHLQALMDQVTQGHRAAVIYVVQRQDCDGFQVASHLDPAYAALSAQASKTGVEFYCYSCIITDSDITLSTALPIKTFP